MFYKLRADLKDNRHIFRFLSKKKICFIYHLLSNKPKRRHHKLIKSTKVSKTTSSQRYQLSITYVEEIWFHSVIRYAKKFLLVFNFDSFLLIQKIASQCTTKLWSNKIKLHLYCSFSLWGPNFFQDPYISIKRLIEETVRKTKSIVNENNNEIRYRKVLPFQVQN